MSDLEGRRKAAIDALTERYARDDLPMDEYERLVADVHRARDERELAVVSDIIGVPAGASSGYGAPSASGRAAAAPTEGSGGTWDAQTALAFLAERRHRGDWLRKPNVSAVSVLGSQVFDFREVDLPAGRTTLEAFAFLGSVDVIVPYGLAVRMEAVPVAGDASVGRGVETREYPGQPILVITGSAVLGSISVKAK